MPARTPDAARAVPAAATVPSEHARRSDPLVYPAEQGELVRVRGIPGASFILREYGSDSGGDYACVLGGTAGHRTERCVTVDRVQPWKKKRRIPRAHSV